MKISIKVKLMKRLLLPTFLFLFSVGLMAQSSCASGRKHNYLCANSTKNRETESCQSSWHGYWSKSCSVVYSLSPCVAQRWSFGWLSLVFHKERNEAISDLKKRFAGTALTENNIKAEQICNQIFTDNARLKLS